MPPALRRLPRARESHTEVLWEGWVAPGAPASCESEPEAEPEKFFARRVVLSYESRWAWPWPGAYLPSRAASLCSSKRVALADTDLQSPVQWLLSAHRVQSIVHLCFAALQALRVGHVPWQFLHGWGERGVASSMTRKLDDVRERACCISSESGTPKENEATP